MTDYDSPWKEALTLYLGPFLAFFFPPIHNDIDWSKGYEPLDKELQQVAPEAARGRRYVDALFKVWLKDGTETWLLIHVEVQLRKEREFPRRMWAYSNRVSDRYNREVVSIAVLADDDRHWRPDHYEESRWGCRKRLDFLTVKLLDYAGHEAELEADRNPFAKVVLAHLASRRTRNDPEARREWKFRLVRNLYDLGLGAEEVRKLFRLIDWLMQLPTPTAAEFWQDLETYQEARAVPFITTPERFGILKGLRRAIEMFVRDRFGEDTIPLLEPLSRVYEADQLEKAAKAIYRATTPEEVGSICQKAAAPPAPRRRKKKADDDA